MLQFPLSMLVRDTGYLTTEESAYAARPWTRVDFLVYRKVDKSPVLVIEADGYAFHREGTRQAERDALKDSVLKKSGLPILRLSTIGSSERSLIRKRLDDVIGLKADHQKAHKSKQSERKLPENRIIFKLLEPK